MPLKKSRLHRICQPLPPLLRHIHHQTIDKHIHRLLRIYRPPSLDHLLYKTHFATLHHPRKPLPQRYLQPLQQPLALTKPQRIENHHLSTLPIATDVVHHI